MPFDVNKARDSGYSDDEILNYLKSTHSFDVKSALRSGYSKHEIITHLSSTPPQTQTPSTPEAVKESLSWGQTLLSATKSVPKSGKQYAKNIYNTIAHPVQTGQSALALAVSGAQALSLQEPSDPYSIGESYKFAQEGARKLQPLVDELKNRYGSIDAFKQTLANDPVGVLADVSSLLIPVGKVTRIGAVTKTGGLLEPFNIAKNSLALPFKLIPEKLPISQYQSAVKFGTTLDRAKLDRVTKIALKEKIMPTARGLRKLRKEINNYNAEVTRLVNESVNQGTNLRVGRIYKGLARLKTKIKRTSSKPAEVEQAFQKIKADIKEALREGKVRTPQEVQEIKQRVYRDLKSYYEQHKSSPVAVELQQAIAKNAKEMLEGIIPEIKQLNKNEGALLELWDTLEQKANRITNRDIISIGLPIKMGVGSGVGYMFGGEAGGKLGSVLGFMLGVYDTPQVKAKLNIVLQTLIDRKIGFKMTPTVARLAGYQFGREQDGNR